MSDLSTPVALALAAAVVAAAVVRAYRRRREAARTAQLLVDDPAVFLLVNEDTPEARVPPPGGFLGRIAPCHACGAAILFKADEAPPELCSDCDRRWRQESHG